jgi:hypothetical protein
MRATGNAHFFVWLASATMTHQDHVLHDDYWPAAGRLTLFGPSVKRAVSEFLATNTRLRLIMLGAKGRNPELMLRTPGMIEPRRAIIASFESA